ncbi:AGE family epimerase/isomerase [Bacteroidota bacterium]
MKRTGILVLVLLVSACSGVQKSQEQLADEIENSLFDYIIEPWYPRCIDTIYGGYIPSFEYDWKLSDNSQVKALVHQTRHLWTTSFLYEHYPEHTEFLDYANQGFQFIQKHFWDDEAGGCFNTVNRDGSVDSSSINEKRIYGQAFAINGLAQYYRVSKNKEALDMAIRIFHWMNERAYDQEYGGYFEILNRDGSPVNETGESTIGDSPLTGLKEFNSSLHILEAFTELYRAWPDSEMRAHLEEMYLQFRDTFIHPDGHLILYFYPDWTPVPNEDMMKRSGNNAWYTQHITYGHDVETAFLLLEAAHALGLEKDEKMLSLSKKMVDHALETGWDDELGGFYYIGYKKEGVSSIHDPHKSFWVESEGLNAIALMHTMYPEDAMIYYDYLLTMWKYIDTYLVDKEYGGWYNFGLDNFPENAKHQKSHNWKATYHDVRGMVRTVEMLRGENTIH